MTNEEIMEQYYQEKHDALLTHDVDVIMDFVKRWDMPPLRRDMAVIWSHQFVCQNVFFTPEERAASTEWLRDNGYSILIKNIKVAQ